MDQDKLKEILEKHRKWLYKEAGGERANLSYADLSSAYLHSADLHSANLSYADLSSADLRSADLRYANLSYADLRYANLSYADLRSADLRSANLSSADLRYANLRSANLGDFKYLHYFLLCPDRCFIIYKKVKGPFILTLKVAKSAQRINHLGSRKLRVSKAKVLEAHTLDWKNTDQKEFNSNHDSNFIYKIGEVVEVKDFDPDFREECSRGIHGYLTKQEAIEY